MANNMKDLRQEVKRTEIADACLGALVLTLIILIPIALIFVELITVFMYRLTFLVVLIIIALFGFSTLFYYLWKKSLRLKEENIKTDINKLFLKYNLITCSVILLLGLIFLFVLIPILWV